MNCRDAESQIFAARDAKLGAADAAILEQHLAECPHCRRLAEGLEAAGTAWRNRDAAVAIPDAAREWHAVRRRIRGADSSPAAQGLPTWGRLLRFALPVAGAAAVLIGISTRVTPPTEPSFQEPAIAHADWSHFEEHFVLAAHAEYVETDNEESSPFVYLDEESGWLIVWASDPVDSPST